MENNLLHQPGTPELAIEILSPVFKGKTVCELGCGTGNIMEAFLKYGAKECIGIEHSPEMVQIAKNKGLNVIEGDLLNMEIPKADVYYNWTPLPTYLHVIDKIQEGIIICGYMPWVSKNLERYNGTKIIIPGYASSEKDSTVFEITIINKTNTVDISAKFHELFHNSLIVHDTHWLGMKAQKCPTDAWMYQDLIYRLKPDFVIETGTAFGGGALFLNTICKAAGRGQVITIENDEDRYKSSTLSDDIHRIFGSSTDDETIRLIKEKVGDGNVLVILDSDHSYEHVRKELELYDQFIKPKFYMIVEDTHMKIVNKVVKEFLNDHKEYEVDSECERYMLTFNPGGFLRKIR